MKMAKNRSSPLTGLQKICNVLTKFDESNPNLWIRKMKVLSSLKTAKKRHKDCQVVKRRGRIYVINKTDPRFKARQG